jgi:hypothetical protein
MKRIRNHMTSAHVIAMLALFVALGGTGYAALSLPRNSVGTKQLKKNAVNSVKVKNHSLKKVDFAAGQIPPGPVGPPGTNGTNGTNGADGQAAAFARVATDGTVQPDVTGFPSQTKGITSAMIVKGEGAAATGNYCFNLPFQPASAVVSLDNADAVAANRNLVTSVAIDRGEDLGDCPAANNSARVRIVDGNTETATDARFFIWFEK